MINRFMDTKKTALDSPLGNFTALIATDSIGAKYQIKLESSLGLFALICA
jgi:hypothetical protein